MKVVLENKEELHAMKERIKKAVDCVLESNSKLSSSERKLIRSQLSQVTSCLTIKVFRRHVHYMHSRMPFLPFICSIVCLGLQRVTGVA